MRLALLILALLLCACAPTAHAASSARLLVPVTVRGGGAVAAPAGAIEVRPLFRGSGGLYAVAAAGSRGWAVGDEGAIVATWDGGATWAPQASGTRGHLISVAASPEVAWAGGWQGVIVATTDGGATWVRQTLPEGVRAIHAVAASGPSSVWVASFDGRVHASRDGGVTWTSSAAGGRRHDDRDGRGRGGAGLGGRGMQIVEARYGAVRGGVT